MSFVAEVVSSMFSRLIEVVAKDALASRQSASGGWLSGGYVGGVRWIGRGHQDEGLNITPRSADDMLGTETERKGQF